MGLLQQLERGKVVTLDEKIDFTAVVDESLLILGQHGQVMFQLDIHALLVFLEDEPVLLCADFLLNLRGKTKKLHCVSILGRFKKVLDCTQLTDKVIAMLLGKIAGAVLRLNHFTRRRGQSPRPTILRHRLAPEGKDAKRNS